MLITQLLQIVLLDNKFFSKKRNFILYRDKKLISRIITIVFAIFVARIKRKMEVYFQKYYQSLCLFSKSVVGDHNVSEDIVQDTFVKIISSGIKFESELHFRQYAYVAVKNTCLKFLSTSSRMPLVDLDETASLTADNDTTDDLAIVKAEIIRMIKNAVDELPPRYREVVRLAYIDNLKNEEIAEELGISVNTVKVMRQRAKAKLRESLKNLFPLFFIYIKFIDFV